MYNNNPSASAVAILPLLWPMLLLLLAFLGSQLLQFPFLLLVYLHAVFVLTAVYVRGVPAVAKVSAVADAPTAVAVLFATGILNVSGVLDVAGFSAVVNMPSTRSCIPAVGVP